MHPFELQIPIDFGVMEVNLPKNALGSMAEGFLESLTASTEYRWHFQARLVIPGMFNDLKADIPVQIDLPEDRVR